MVTPVISLNTITGTFDGTRDENRDRILASDLVKFLGEQPGASVVSLVLDVEGDIPAEGLEVVVNSDSDFSEYFSRLGRQPFSLGGEVIDAVYDDDGVPAGIKLLVTGPNALFSFSVAETEEAETDGPEMLTFSLAEGADYSINGDAQASTITFYDSLADVPAPTSTPTVGLSVDNTELVEANGDSLTLTFNVDGDIPDDGVLVYVNSGVRAAVGEFNIFAAEVNGGVFPASNFLSSGFYFKVFEDGASIKLDVFDETTNPQIEPEDAVEGIESFTFSIVEGPGYAIDAGASEISYTIADAADSVPLVRLETSPAVLVESEGTVSVHEFTLSTAPPAEGITVSVEAPNLGEFDLSQIVVTGGAIAAVTDTGFDFTITEQSAVIELPVADDGEAEGIETATFTLQPGTGYSVSPADNGGEFTIGDTPISAPPSDTESNDTIATAVATGLTADNHLVTVSGALEQQRDPAVDRTEDVDMYSVELAAGDVFRVDTDAQAISDDSPDTVLRVFDASGNQVAQSDDDFAPDELFAPGRRDSYIEFTAETVGSYYVGVSSFGNGAFDFFVDDDGNLENDPYDPNEAGSGAGRSFGEYTINMSLNQDFVASETEVPASTGEGPTVSISATPATYDADDNLIANALVQFTPERRTASILTFGLDVEGAIPEGGVEAYLTSSIDLSSVFSTGAPFSSDGVEVLGAIFNGAGEAVGVRINLTANSGFLNLNLADPEEAPTDGEETVSFTLAPSAGYTVREGEFSTTVYDTLEDVPALPTVPTVSISASETALIESEGNTTTLTLTLDSPPPAEGVTINVDSGVRAALGEFDVFNAVIEGGNFPSPNFRASGFFFTMTEQTATITLAAFDETTNPQIPAEDALEGIDELTFTVQPGVGYAVAPEANAITLTIADNPDSVVIDPGDGNGGGEDPAIPFEVEFNDTIADATETGLSADDTSFLIQAEIDSTRRTRNFIDPTEDVDMYAFTMKAGDTVTLDIDSIPFELEDFEDTQAVDTEIRVFNAAGEELLLNTEAPAPGELFESGRDAYVEFTAAEDGTYYAGVAMLSNRDYDPNVQGSGSGRAFENFGISPGEYTLEANLTVGDAGEDETILGSDGDDDMLDGDRGNDLIAGGLGNDIIMGGEGMDVLRGDLNNRKPQDNVMGGDDIIFGGSGDDRIGGKAGNDILSGDAGDDFIWGDDGDDIIMGVTGNDTLVGDNFSDGSGSDLFVFGSGDGTDTILDFEVGIDRIGLVEGELLFADLTLTQDGANTLLGVASSSETLAILNNVQASALTESSFEAVPDVSNPEEALAII
ncbi:pre-peptidase C-terminal domain-containing protein [cf. Phormidesmis sp. LEGE 11477]|uniref:pre-peptidase C-terminal domain-containing protein n=1 Tax=cf. Phormidesmis sp. LEGE 11477 TaxID=1828680 RepID=UPI0018805F5C|nr:pre-peptidase C-terminal domain-containing protein [cf. Phormidesmis sp. LEGE 11477]MBE9063505.1 pre-peptidase C-terminal domain-containing protein [cf. Phormidesmis sp. LEGE 11477]